MFVFSFKAMKVILIHKNLYSVNVITLGLSQSDHIKRLPLYIVKVNIEK